jgi:hypothetical protein
MTPSQPYVMVVRVLYPCVVTRKIASFAFRLVVPASSELCFNSARFPQNQGVRPCFLLIQQDIWSWTAERQLPALSLLHELPPRFVFRFGSGSWRHILVVCRRPISASRLLCRFDLLAYHIFR